MVKRGREGGVCVDAAGEAGWMEWDGIGWDVHI